MSPKPIFIVSGGMGASARQVLDTVLAQFVSDPADVVKLTLVRDADAVERAVDAVAEAEGLLIHTLVEPQLRELLARRAAARGLPTVDLFGDLMVKLTAHLGCQPLAHPGRFRELNRAYCDRIDAIEFAIQHDDSQSAHSLRHADIVLIGVSRSGKTPLTMYLAMQGWKVANVSYVPNVELPRELELVAKGRVVGLLIAQDKLIAHRRRRQGDVGLVGTTPYVAERAVFDELEGLRDYLREQRIAAIDITDKPIESTAREVVSLVVGRLGDAAKQG